jgi:hypothetical protein
MDSETPNFSVNRTACKLRLQVPSALRAPAAGYLHRYAASSASEMEI